VVLHDKDICIGCGYCFYACPFGAPQFPLDGAFATRGKMDKCTFCAGGPETDNSADEHRKYGSNRLAEGKLPLCAEMCSTKALLAGDADVISEIYRKRIINRGAAVLARGVSYQDASFRAPRNVGGKSSANE
jgi:formate dehydrogenase iron-sulfur subunit